MLLCTKCYQKVSVIGFGKDSLDERKFNTKPIPVNTILDHDKENSVLFLPGKLPCNKVPCTGNLVLIEDGIAEILLEYWKIGILTEWSCQGHLRYNTRPYVVFGPFPDNETRNRFNEALTNFTTNNPILSEYILFEDFDFFDINMVAKIRVSVEINSTKYMRSTSIEKLKLITTFQLFLIDFLEYLKAQK